MLQVWISRASAPSAQRNQTRPWLWCAPPWPDILTALGSGHTLKRVCQELNKDGLAIGYKTLSAYVGRLRRERTGNVRLRETPARRPLPLSVPSLRHLAPAASDPLAQAMEACARPRYDIIAAHCDGDPSKKKLI